MVGKSEGRILTTSEFLAEKVYLPGYMALSNPDYDLQRALFDFRVREPPVARGGIVDYLTPRGLHICISQGGYAIVEHMADEGLFEGFDVANLRDILLEGRVKIVELFQKFRRNIEISKPVPGKLEIVNYRVGRLPMLRMNFDFANGGITGNLVSVIAPKPVAQTNEDILRN